MKTIEQVKNILKSELQTSEDSLKKFNERFSENPSSAWLWDSESIPYHIAMRQITKGYLTYIDKLYTEKLCLDLKNDLLSHAKYCDKDNMQYVKVYSKLLSLIES